MGVNHFLLAVTTVELNSVLANPVSLRELSEKRRFDSVVELLTDGLAIIFLIAEDENDPILFLHKGAPDDVSGWVGEYREKDGTVRKCEVDMGYGPASYYRNSFVRVVAQQLEQWSEARFA